MMVNMGYNLAQGEGLYFGRGRRTFPRPFVPKGKPDDFYHKLRRGLGYITPTPPQCHESWREARDSSSTNSSAESSLWESDVSIGAMFKGLTANMATANPEESDGEDQIPVTIDSWDQHLNIQWDARFEQ